MDDLNRESIYRLWGKRNKYHGKSLLFVIQRIKRKRIMKLNRKAVSTRHFFRVSRLSRVPLYIIFALNRKGCADFATFVGGLFYLLGRLFVFSSRSSFHPPIPPCLGGPFFLLLFLRLLPSTPRSDIFLRARFSPLRLSSHLSGSHS